MHWTSQQQMQGRCSIGTLIQICMHAGAVEDAEAVPCGISRTVPILTRALWQCGGGYQELTGRAELLQFDLLQRLSDVQQKATAR